MSKHIQDDADASFAPVSPYDLGNKAESKVIKTQKVELHEIDETGFFGAKIEIDEQDDEPRLFGSEIEIDEQDDEPRLFGSEIEIDEQKADEGKLSNPKVEIKQTHLLLTKKERRALNYATRLSDRNIFTVLASPLARMIIDNNSLSKYQDNDKKFSINKFYKLQSKIDKIIKTTEDVAKFKELHMRLSFEVIKAYLNHNLQAQTSAKQAYTILDLTPILNNIKDFMDKDEALNEFLLQLMLDEEKNKILGSRKEVVYQPKDIIEWLVQTEIAALNCKPENMLAGKSTRQFSEEIVDIVKAHGGDDLKDALVQRLTEYLSKIPKEQYTAHEQRIEESIRTLLGVELDVDIGIKHEPHKGGKVQFNDNLDFSNDELFKYEKLDLAKKPQFGSSLPEITLHSKNVAVIDLVLDNMERCDKIDEAIQKGITKEEAEKLLDNVRQNGTLSAEIQLHIVDAIEHLGTSILRNLPADGTDHEIRRLNIIDDLLFKRDNIEAEKKRIDACVENLIPILEECDDFESEWGMREALWSACESLKKSQSEINRMINKNSIDNFLEMFGTQYAQPTHDSETKEQEVKIASSSQTFSKKEIKKSQNSLQNQANNNNVNSVTKRKKSTKVTWNI